MVVFMTNIVMQKLVFQHYQWFMCRTPGSSAGDEEDQPGFTDDNKEWLKPAKSKKPVPGKKSALPLDEDSDDDDMVSRVSHHMGQ